MSKRLGKVLPSLLMTLFGLTVILIIPSQIKQVDSSELSADFFPYLLGGLIVILSLISMIAEFLKANKTPETEKQAGVKGVNKQSYSRFIIIVLGLILWILSIPFLGFVVTNVLITAGMMWVLGNRNLYLLLLLPVIFTAFLYYLFVVLLYVSFPSGIFL